jgi:hypothetical protein
LTSAGIETDFRAPEAQADFEARVDGWQEAAAPTDLLPDTQLAMTDMQPDLGSMLEMAAMPVPSADLLQGLGTNAPAELGDVLADAIEQAAQGPDINALIEALPIDGAVEAIQGAGGMGSGAEQFVNHDWSGLQFQNVFDVAMAAQEVQSASNA